MKLYWAFVITAFVQIEEYMVAKNPLDKFIHVHFYKDSSGAITLHEEYEDIVDLTFARLEDVSYTRKDLLGRYVNEITGAVLKVKNTRKGIKAKKGIIKLVLIALREDMFYSSNTAALFSFERDKNGTVVNLVVNAYDFRNFQLRRVN